MYQTFTTFIMQHTVLLLAGLFIIGAACIWAAASMEEREHTTKMNGGAHTR